ncbi:MAG: DNA translocase FtsK 4TM domain-containing protein [Zetaproteobacteria bacterium]|nr:DNA translocase FtsK 4TM domain-containing protein [Zetaproteobacteria bacterium]
MQGEQKKNKLGKASSTITLIVILTYYWLALFFHEHNPNNPYGLHIQETAEQPIFGSLGTLLATHLVHLFGYTSFLFPLFIFTGSILAPPTAVWSSRILYGIQHFLLATLSSLIVIATFSPPLPDQGFRLQGEGLIGEWLQQQLIRHTGQAGIGAVFTLAALFMITNGRKAWQQRRAKLQGKSI